MVSVLLLLKTFIWTLRELDLKSFTEVLVAFLTSFASLKVFLAQNSNFEGERNRMQEKEETRKAREKKMLHNGRALTQYNCFANKDVCLTTGKPNIITTNAHRRPFGWLGKCVLKKYLYKLLLNEQLFSSFIAVSALTVLPVFFFN